LDPDFVEALKIIAEEDGIPLEAVVRRALEEYERFLKDVRIQ
jgi:hypothetical protein